MDTRDYVIVGVLVAVIVWWFCRRKAACSCGPRMAAADPARGPAGRCGPFACGSSSRPAPRRGY